MAVDPEIWLDGQTVSGAQLKALALSVPYGAVTSFAVHDGAVRGLDLHLKRLSQWAVDLFGEAVDPLSVQRDLANALGGRREAWVRLSLYAPQLTPRAADWTGRPQVLMGLYPPVASLKDGQVLKTISHQRFEANFKHAGSFDLIRSRRVALLAGADDAVFVDADGHITEGTLWNIGFMAGEVVVWPQAAMLDGVTQRLIRQGLSQQGIAQRHQPIALNDLSQFDAAFICNSATPAASVARIDDYRFSRGEEALSTVRAAWQSHPPHAIHRAP